MDVFIGTIETFAFPFAPRDWAQCRGQIQSIAQNTALFSLLGVQYGGNGTTTFALPNLQSRVMVNQGQGPGLSPYMMGEEIGLENEHILQSSMPRHGHSLNASTVAATITTPDTTVILGAANGEDGDLAPITVKTYSPSPASTLLSPTSVGVTGGSLPMSVIQPVLTINTSIALYGIYPTRS